MNTSKERPIEVLSDSDRGLYQWQHIADIYGSTIHLDDGLCIGPADLARLHDPDTDFEAYVDLVDTLLSTGFVVDCYRGEPLANTIRYYFRMGPCGDVLGIPECRVDEWDAEENEW